MFLVCLFQQKQYTVKQRGLCDMPFNRNRLKLLPLNKRIHDLNISAIKELQENSFSHPSFNVIAANIKNAKKGGKPVIMILCGHVIRSGVQRYIIDMMEQGY